MAPNVMVSAMASGDHDASSSHIDIIFAGPMSGASIGTEAAMARAVRCPLANAGFRRRAGNDESVTE